MKSFYSNNPMFFAHRGCLIKKPENTINSFLEAIKIGAEAIEVDIIKTKDNKIICSHDYYLDINTNKVGDISEMEYSYLKDGIKSRASTNNNDYFPQLENVIKNIPDEVKINIEIKTRKVIDILIVKELVSIIKRMNISHKVLVSSFNPLAIWYAKILDKNIRTGFLYDNPRFLFLKNIIHPDCIHPKQSLVTQNLVKHSKDRGLSVNVWTVNNKAAINWLIKQGVDGIITDNPKYFSKKN